ncbi:hypothetical protein BLA60_26505 [Actinophytocola xinjiangensis]|uniref:DUF2637 domain-containing protein n=1 Tax=Actinophytocola xinjiangensis TaxID=485602 RepID=A0A7Z0WHX9_9PSEU|nr:hypothetical protein [Actinophytocola xinjiangensis]OLF07485.1 hypothetical protein BLA60_26505 [Actinophytocola xinjiangensis]
MSWREERRRDRAAEAEQERANAVTAAEVAAIRERVRADADQGARAQRERLRQARKDAVRQRRVRLLVAARSWLAVHVVDLLIYPLAVVSAVMAVPAMATFGHEVYGTAAGYALPVITELGMWAFAVAVQYTRRRYQDRPVWALQLGVWSFATVAAALNALHGLTRGVDAAVVMAISSVAGVAAHQLVTAAPRRSPVERLARRQARKVTTARGAAVRAAVAEIDVDGAARLVFAPGRYRLGWRRQLTPAPDSTWDPLDRELAELLANSTPWPDPGPSATGSVGTLDRADDQRGSTRRSRSIDELKAELRARIKADPGSIDPTSAESIRRALRCSPARARRLRDHLSGEKEV